MTRDSYTDVRRTAARFAVALQSQPTGCAAACLRTIASFYGVTISDAESLRRCPARPGGTAMDELAHALHDLGMRPRPIAASLAYMVAEARLPAILHWQQRHYVVLLATDGERFLIADPGFGLRVVELNAFRALWTGDEVRSEGEGYAIVFRRPGGSTE